MMMMMMMQLYDYHIPIDGIQIVLSCIFIFLDAYSSFCLMGLLCIIYQEQVK